MLQRKFIPGSKWFYIKIYTGIKTADTLLTGSIHTIIKQLKKEKLIDKWFFIRYSDPDFHLRIRILMKDTASFGYITNLFYDRFRRLVDENIIWNIKFDTYNRELERYGSSMIEYAETYFYIDSETILSLIKAISRNYREEYRWMISFKLIDNLLTDFSFSIEEKKELMSSLSNSFKLEFGIGKYNAKTLNKKYRENRKLLNEIIKEQTQDLGFNTIMSLVNTKTRKIKSLLKQLHSFTKENDMIHNMLPSFIHMMMNRLFASQSRQYELAIYDLMYRY